MGEKMEKQIGNVLVIQLERPGDIILTTAFLKLAREKYPGARLDFLQMDSFQGIVEGAPFVDNVLYFPVALYGANKNALERMSDSGEGIDDALLLDGGLREEIRRLSGYDVVYNLAHDAFSLWLNTQLDAPEKHGGVMAPDGRRFFLDLWNIYLVAFVHGFRNENRIHLLDLYKGCAGAVGSGVTLPYINCEAVEIEEGLVALSPGASSYAKAWPAEHFAALSDRLSAEGYKTVLVGGGADRALCERVYSLCAVKPLNMCGKTTVAQAAGLLKKCRILISHDTGTIHMAAAVGTPVLYISCGEEAYFRETSPYSGGNYIMQTALGGGYGGADISPESVMALFGYMEGSVSGEALAEKTAAQGVPLAFYVSYLFSEQCDGVGGIGFRPLFRGAASQEAFYIELLRYALVAGMGGYTILERGIAEIGNNVGSAFAAVDGDVEAMIHLTQRSERELASIAESFMQGAEMLMNPSRHQELAELLVRIQEKEAGFEVLAESGGVLQPVFCTLSWALKMVLDEAPEAIFATSARIYAAFARVLETQAMLLSKVRLGDGR
ncbi:hypothetical protein MoryE10_01300 [Methylogaea oryzae]|uniref:Glycosyltransferase family 9 protein n=2 Tax=Methylogaea oryzae TaxID=1295382 RepID=A0A8D5AIA3_9GAMM|nr:hypothetical protein MoryE10_01300 [Methylogaea oryzae]